MIEKAQAVDEKASDPLGKPLWPYELDLMKKLSALHPLAVISIRRADLDMRTWFDRIESVSKRKSVDTRGNTSS